MRVAEGLSPAGLGPTTWSGNDVDVTSVERHLTDLWKQVSAQKSDRPAVRTRVFNLIVYTRSLGEAQQALELLDRVPQRHPSRSIVLVGDRRNPTSSVDAELAVQCTEVTSSGTRSCYERAVLTVHGRAAEHLASACIPLLVPQLATYLWWPGQPLFGHRLFHRMVAIADALIVDSSQFVEPGDGFSSLASLCLQRYRVNDFHWARLTSWREIITQFFDGPQLQPYARCITAISLEFGVGRSGAGATAGILLLLGWLASRLDWQPETTLDSVLDHGLTLAVMDHGRLIPISITLVERGDQAAGKLLSCRFEAHGKGMAPASFSIRRSHSLENVEVAMEIGTDKRPTKVMPIGIENDAKILSDELEMTGQDNLYDSVLSMASRMAGREVLAPG